MELLTGVSVGKGPNSQAVSGMELTEEIFTTGLTDE
jgi:hypothetical protein